MVSVIFFTAWVSIASLYGVKKEQKFRKMKKYQHKMIDSQVDRKRILHYNMAVSLCLKMNMAYERYTGRNLSSLYGFGRKMKALPFFFSSGPRTDLDRQGKQVSLATAPCWHIPPHILYRVPAQNMGSLRNKGTIILVHWKGVIITG